MKVIGILGSPVKRGTNSLLQNALEALAAEGVETELLHITDYDLQFCQGCNTCLREGRCVLEDDLTKIGDKLIEADGIIMASPSYFGSPTAQLKNLMDRSRYLKMQDHKLKDKLLGVISSSGLNQGGGQSTIEDINRFGLTHGMLIIGPAATPQTDANMVVGTSETEEGWQRVKDDKKAVKLAKNLGSRMADTLDQLNK
ncbi:MAG TPA: flavodoxin family protein [Halanaerobiales bacterium]|nr:flavodoxin family protein [Halanaerobiales bacterium]